MKLGKVHLLELRPMRTARAALGCALLVSAAVFAAQAAATVESIAFASFAPLNTDIFLAAHDGSDAVD
jgi:hypothetical protein